MALRWIHQHAIEHCGQMMVIPAWVKADSPDDPEDLRIWLEANNVPNSWWQIKNGDKRLFCQWQNAGKNLWLIHGLFISETDPSMLVVGAGWVECIDGRYTGRVEAVRYGLDMQGPNWHLTELTTYGYLKVLGGQIKKERDAWEINSGS